MKKWCALLVLFLSVSGAVQSQTVNTEACDKGNAQACYLAAIELHQAKQYDQAAYLAQKSCDMDFAQGCFYLGFKNQNAQRYNQCNVYFKKACDLNYGPGCLAVANNLRLGIGVQPSLKAAMSFFQKACSLGEPLGCSHLKNPGFEGHNVHGGVGK